jgi:hypothetical protein
MSEPGAQRPGKSWEDTAAQAFAKYLLYSLDCQPSADDSVIAKLPWGSN